MYAPERMALFLGQTRKAAKIKFCAQKVDPGWVYDKVFHQIGFKTLDL